MEILTSQLPSGGYGYEFPSLTIRPMTFMEICGYNENVPTDDPLAKYMYDIKVLLHDEEFDEDIEYKIVGSSEADSLSGKISNESPVGHALIGAKIGDTVEVVTPAGASHFKVLEIQRSEVA